MNVEIAGNVYPNPTISPENYVFAERNKHVFGADVEKDGVSLIPDSTD